MGIKTSQSKLSYAVSLIAGGVTQSENQSMTLWRYRSGNENPRWRQQIREGSNATTDLSAYEETAETTSGSWSGIDDSSPAVPYCHSNKQGIDFSVSPLAVPGNSVTYAQAVATAKAYKIINQKLSQFSGQAFMGEMKETKNLLMNPFKRSVELAKSLVAARKVGKNAAKSWLEFQFGIKPLLSDVDALIDMINKQFEKEKRLAYRTYGTKSDVLKSSVTDMFDIYGFYQRVDKWEELKAECIIHFAVTQAWLDSANKEKSRFSDSFSDVSDIPETTWELLPWSWLVDYFVNVSDILQAACTSTAGLSYVSKSTIRTYRLTKIGTTEKVATSQYHITGNVPRVFKYQKRNVDRVGTPLGIPSVVFSLPGRNVQYLNLAALIASLTPNLNLKRLSRLPETD